MKPDNEAALTLSQLQDSVWGRDPQPVLFHGADIKLIQTAFFPDRDLVGWEAVVTRAYDADPTAFAVESGSGEEAVVEPEEEEEEEEESSEHPFTFISKAA